MKPVDLLNFSETAATANLISVIAKLVGTLVPHVSKQILQPDIVEVNEVKLKLDLLKVPWIRKILNSAKLLAYGETDINDCLDSFNSIMNSFAEIFRSIVLSGGDKDVLNYFDDKTYLYQCTDCFVAVAAYSSQLNRCSKLLRLLLNNLSASQVNKLKKCLLESQEYMTQYTLDHISTSTDI